MGTQARRKAAGPAGDSVILPAKLQAAVLYLESKGRLDDLPEDVVAFIRSNLSTDERLHLWAFMVGNVGVKV